MRRIFLSAAFIFGPALAFAALEDRIQGPIDTNSTVVLRGNTQPRARAQDDRGPLDPLTMIGGMRMVLKPSARQASELAAFLEEQRNPASPDFHKWLTPEQYGERFGVSQRDLGTLTSWLQAQGFTVGQVARARNWITFSGTAAQIAQTFHTELHRYQTGNETHFANATEPTVPAALADIVSELRGLDDYKPKPLYARLASPDYTTAGGSHYLAPDDFATIYDITALYNAGFSGAGQKLVIAGQTDINLSDISTFRSAFHLPANPPQVILAGPDPGVSQGDQVEADLDLEWSGAVARNATIIFVNSRNVFESVQYAIDQNLAPVISMSYGECELGGSASARAMAQQANAEGITWMNSSGDSGAAGCDYGTKVASNGPSVTFPADIPEVTAVGGTEFNEAAGTGWNSQNGATLASATEYLPEMAWNDTPLGNGIEATGGGVSTLFAKPWWQTGPGVPSDGARDVPDVALAASADHDGYLLLYDGALMVVGGTSASSPTFAGIVALINQYLVAKGAQANPGLGNINPNLYGLAQNTAGVFHDVTTGNNIVPCANGSPGCSTGSFGYKAGPGYDLTTGLGSVDAYNLATKWSSYTPGVGTTMTLTASAASIAATASTTLTATVAAVTGATKPTGSVTFSIGATTLGTSVVAAGTATLVVKGSSLAVGANVITASYSATGNFTASTASYTVTLVGPAVATTTTVAANPQSIAANATTQLTATVKPASGSTAPTGSVTFSAGTTSLGTATLVASGSSATAVLTVGGGKLAMGANSIAVSYAGAPGFSPSAATPLTVTVTAPLIATTTTLAANPSTIAASANTQLTVTVKPASGTTAPTGSVAFTLGTTSLGSAVLASSTASLTVKASSLAAGANTITASYGGSSSFSASSAIVTVTVTVPPVATTTVVAASSASIAPTGTTQLTVTVKPATGSVAPTGNVTLTAGTTSLGSAALAPSGSNGIATIAVNGSSLKTGANTITANYTATGNFTNSSGSTAITLTPPLPATTATLTASPATIAQSATTLLTASIKPATGAIAPTGSVTFSVGGTSLGTSNLATAGGTASASLTVGGASLASGANTITATYSGSGTFAGSTATVTVNVTAPASDVVASASPKPNLAQSGWGVNVQLQEEAGTATTLTGFTINGTNFTSSIAAFFGSTKIAAHGTLSANLIIQWLPLPANIVFAFTGVDAGGMQWSRSVSIATAAAAAK
ncbi:MAG: Ig-like domain repeat protein [Bryobacteraceae bacterium]|jgi:subtilase family serine protease